MRMPICGVVGLSLLLFTASTGAYELRAAFAPECPTTKEPAKLGESILGAAATAVAMAFVDKLVDAGIAATKKMLVPDAKSVEGQFLIDGIYTGLYGTTPDKKAVDTSVKRAEPATELTCFIVAIGEFGDSLPDTWALPETFKLDIQRKNAASRLQTMLNLKTAPIFYFEAIRAVSPDATATTWVPVRFHVSEFLDTSFFAGASRSVAITMKLYKPGASSPFATQLFSFNDVPNKLPFTQDYSDLRRGSAGQWMAMPAPSERYKNVDFKPNEKTGTPFDPFTLEVKVGQTPKPYQLAQLLADSVEAKSTDIKTAVENTVFTAKGDAASRTAATATIKVIGEYLTALTALTAACPSIDPGKIAESVARAKCHAARDSARIAADAAKAACDNAPVETCQKLPAIDAPPTGY